VLAPDGFPLWTSEAEPGSLHDITAARIHALPALYRARERPDRPGRSRLRGRARPHTNALKWTHPESDSLDAGLIWTHPQTCEQAA
jgi:hypothetical protein